MKVKKYLAPSARAALAKVKNELGADAVILSNRSTAGGVEILALASRDIAGVVSPHTAPAPRAGAAKPLKDFARRVEPTMAPLAPPAAADTRVYAELKAMRGLVEQQLASLAWNEDARRNPQRAEALRELLAAGYSAPLGRKVSQALPEGFNAAQARQWLRAVLAKNLRCATDADNMVERGGIYALVGPTGVGKTTTAAKIAARGVVRYGAHNVGLVSTDGFRIGAQDQLRTYAKILGVPAHTVQDAAGLEQALRALAGRRLVLIDTAGMGQRDARLAEQLELLADARIRRLLLLNASSQLETLEEVALAYARHALHGAVLAKLDEARRPGAALDVAMRHKLPLAFVTDGQRVPEDLRLPVAGALVERSLEGAATSPFALGMGELAALPAAAAKARRAA
jgi:flagellar biosynthesis protein FlhF